MCRCRVSDLVRVAALSYSSAANTILEFDTTYDVDAAISLINASSYLGGPSDIVTALDTTTIRLFARSSSGSRGINGAVVVLTDGINDNSLALVQDASQSLLKFVSQTVAIGVGVDMSADDLRAIASASNNVFLGDSDGLGSVTPELVLARIGNNCAARGTVALLGNVAQTGGDLVGGTDPNGSPTGNTGTPASASAGSGFSSLSLLLCKLATQFSGSDLRSPPHTPLFLAFVWF